MNEAKEIKQEIYTIVALMTKAQERLQRDAEHKVSSLNDLIQPLAGFKPDIPNPGLSKLLSKY